MSNADERPKFIDTREARRILGLRSDDQRIYKLIKNGTIRIRRLPNMRPELLRADVERLAAEYDVRDVPRTPNRKKLR